MTTISPDDDGGVPDKKISDAARMVNFAEGIIRENVQDYLLLHTGMDGMFQTSSNNKTWAIGAAKRLLLSLDEQERIDQRRRDAEGED